MTVSAVITTCGRGWNTVRRALESVLRQSCPVSEILLVDDNPPGSEYTEEIRKGLAAFPAVRYLTRGRNCGVAEARNFALENASGDWIAFLDDDDRWLPDKIEKQLAAAQAHPEAGLIYALGTICDASGKDIGPVWQASVFKENPGFLDMLARDHVGSTSQPLIRTETIRSLGGFHPLPAAEDYELWIRIAERYELYGIPEFVYIKHMERGAHVSRNNGNYFHACCAIYAEWKQEYRRHAAARKGICRNIIRGGIKAGDPAVIPYCFIWAFACMDVKTGKGG